MAAAAPHRPPKICLLQRLQRRPVAAAAAQQHCCSRRRSPPAAAAAGLQLPVGLKGCWVYTARASDVAALRRQTPSGSVEVEGLTARSHEHQLLLAFSRGQLYAVKIV